MTKNRFFKLLPVLCWMGLIFYLSSQPAKDQDLAPFFAVWIDQQSLQTILPEWKISYSEDEFEVQQEPYRFVNFVIRKSAHLFTYALLAILCLRFFRSCHVHINTAITLAWLTSTLYGASDEWHQTWVMGRTGVIEDVVMDACGAVIGLIVYVRLKKIRRKVIEKPEQVFRFK